MIRAVAIIVACVSVTIVLVEAGAGLVMWQKGYLTPHYLREIKLVFTTTHAETGPAADDAAKPASTSTLDDVVKTRAVKVLDLAKRESDLEQLHRNLSTQSEKLNEQQASFRERRKAFDEELEKLKSTLLSAGTEQARGILMAMAPTDAAQKLMQISEADGIRLLKGIPEKVIAKILKELSVTPEQNERSKKLFDALGRGEPEISVVDAAQKANAESPATKSP